MVGFYSLAYTRTQDRTGFLRKGKKQELDLSSILHVNGCLKTMHDTNSWAATSPSADLLKTSVSSGMNDAIVQVCLPRMIFEFNFYFLTVCAINWPMTNVRINLETIRKLTIWSTPRFLLKRNTVKCGSSYWWRRLCSVNKVSKTLVRRSLKGSASYWEGNCSIETSTVGSCTSANDSNLII